MQLRLFPALTLLSLNGWAQPVLSVPGKLPSDPMEIGIYTSFYRDVSGDTLPLHVIRFKQFRPFAQKINERAHFASRSLIVTWLRFTIRNTHPTDTLHLLYNTHVHGLITLYQGTNVIGRNGLGWPQTRRPAAFALPLNIPAQTEQTFYVRVVDFFWSPRPVLSEILTENQSYRVDFRHFWTGSAYLMAAMWLLTGVLLLMGLYSAYSLFLVGDHIFLYHTVYILICLVYCVYQLDYQFGFGNGSLFPARLSGALAPVQIPLITFSYCLFCDKALNIRANQPKVWLALRALMVVLLLQAIYGATEWFFARPFFLSNVFYTYSIVPTVLTSCVLIICALRSRLPIRRFLVAGLAAQLVIGFLPNAFKVYLQGLPLLVDTFVNYVDFWVILGLSVEAFSFMLALAYRGRLIEIDNSRIQDSLRMDLETQLEQRTREIEDQNRLLEAHRIRQIESQFEQKLAEIEMTSLRAQMNPHFIFNCLNSIKLYTLDNEADKASEYLTKFARLIRLVLENSRVEKVSLQAELEALKLYIELEAMRFKQKVQFSILVAPEIDQCFVRLPPLLLQPYVENAIWHGLMHKPGGGTVSIRVTQPDENLLYIEITDDGVGRMQAAKLKSKSAGKHKSFGMQVTADRIGMINRMYNTRTQAGVADLTDASGEPCGTQVILEIPI